MKFNLSIIHIFIFCILFSGCNDRDKPFYGDWRANLGSGFITFKKNGSVKYLGKSGSWKTEWNSRFCTYCSNGGKLTLKLSGKSYEFGFSFLSSKRSTNDNKIISLTDQKTKVRNYFTNNGLSIKQFPNTLPSGWAHENKGLMHYEKIEAVYFSANHVFSLVNRVGAEKNQLFKKSGSSWSKVNFGGLKANDSVEDMMVRDQEIFIFTKTGQIIFSANEGKSFESFNQKVPEAYRSNKNFRFDLKTAVFNNTLYAAVTTETDVETEELGPHTQHGLNVYEMIDYNNSARSDWKLIKTFTGKGNGGADLASDGIHLVISFRLSGNGHQVYKTSNGMFWKKEIPSPVKQNNFLIFASANGKLGAFTDDNAFIMDNSGSWKRFSIPTIISPDDAIPSLDGNTLYFSNEYTGEGFSMDLSRGSSSKKKLVTFPHFSRKEFRLYSGHGRYYVSTDQGLFSKNW